MQLELDDEQATELGRVVREALGDLSSEIADTDNPEYRRILRRRREVLTSLAQGLPS